MDLTNFIILTIIAIGMVLAVIAISAVMLSGEISAEERREAFRAEFGGDEWDWLSSQD